MPKDTCYFKLQYTENLPFTFHAAEAYSEPFQATKMEFFVKKINGFQLLTS